MGSIVNVDHSKDHEGSAGTDELLTDAEIDRLARMRPNAFSGPVSEWLFVFSAVGSILMAEFFISGFNLVQTTVAAALEIPEVSQTWPISVSSLVTGAFLLPLGRLGDIVGGYVPFLSGLIWFFVWSLIAGFSQSYQMLIAARALAGLGPAAFLPAGLMIMAKLYRPGPRKNLVFGIYGAFAPLGFFGGIMIGGLTGQFLSWRWYFWIGSILLFLLCVTSFLTIPSDFREERPKDVGMDWWGTVTVVPALILIVFALTDGSRTPDGWKTPYILGTFIPGVLLLLVFIYVEGWVASYPLLPFDLFRPKYLGLLVISLFFAYGTFGIYLFYASSHIQSVMGMSPLLTAVWFIPMAGGGVIISVIAGFTLHVLPGRLLLIISGLGCLASVLLFALIPDGANFWAFVFPAMVGCTIGIDITYNVSNVFITTNVPRHHQGVTGALIHSLLFFGVSFFLGVADLAVAEVERRGHGYNDKVAFWVGTACAAVSLVIFAFIDVGTAKSQ
ncbi:major facilitator superfamily domain-containing protein [Xylogone sp. PMI_703]|nr:major facilitator superfamily domain-containing protein [Xylogone sp. PMI_703]